MPDDNFDNFDDADVGGDLEQAIRENEIERQQAQLKPSTPVVDTPVVEDTKEEVVVEDEKPEDDPLNDFLNGDEEKVVEESDDDFDQKFAADPENLKGNKKAQAAWGDLRKEAKTFKTQYTQAQQEAQQLRAEVERLKANPAVSDDGWKAKYEEVIKKDARLQLEESEEFQKNIIQPLIQVEDNLTKLAESYNIPKGELEKAIFESKSSVERNRALYKIAVDAEMNDFDRQDLAAVSQDLLVLESKRHEGIKNAQAIYEASKAGKDLESKKEQELKFNTLLTEKAKVEGILNKSPIISEFLPKVDKGKLDTYLRGEVEPKIQAYHGFAGLVLPAVLEEVKSLRAALKSKVGDSHRVTPGSGGTRTVVTKDDDLEPGEDVFNSINKWKSGRQS